MKTALTVRRLMGTAAAVKLQVHAIYPEATVTEWFQYDGKPGCFRVSLPLPKEGITAAEYRRLKTGHPDHEERAQPPGRDRHSA